MFKKSFMKIKIFKTIIIFFLSLVALLIFMILFDLSKYDPSYINRKSLTFNVNNLNSKKIRKIFEYFDNLYYEINYQIFESHRNYWKTEELSARINLPKIKKIPKKNKNFLP